MPWVVIKAIKCQLTVFLRGLLQTPIPHRDLGGGGLGLGNRISPPTHPH